MKKNKDILIVCLNCGRKNDKKQKESFGVWNDIKLRSIKL